MNYELKEKITVTRELLNELEEKSWLEIDQIQTYITNLAEDPANDDLRQLLKNLLTSYYIFTGNIEALSSNFSIKNQKQLPLKTINGTEVQQVTSESSPTSIVTIESTDDTLINNNTNEPFEYFIDFDEPIGEPLSDKDLYG